MRQSIASQNARRRIVKSIMQHVVPSAILLTLFVPEHSHARSVRKPITIPAGTTFAVETVSELSSKMSSGTRFETRLKNDLVVNGHVVTSAGTTLYGVITQSEGGKQFGKQRLATTIIGLQWKGQLVPLAADTAGVVAKPGGGLLKIGGGRIVGGAMLGAPGAIAGGVAGNVVSKNQPRHITIPAGKEIDVHLRTPVHLP
jgi:hypothetical protein